MAKQHTAKFTFAKDCKGSRQYKEVPSAGGEELVGTLYLKRPLAEGVENFTVQIVIP